MQEADMHQYEARYIQPTREHGGYWYVCDVETGETVDRYNDEAVAKKRADAMNKGEE